MASYCMLIIIASYCYILYWHQSFILCRRPHHVAWPKPMACQLFVCMLYLNQSTDQTQQKSRPARLLYYLIHRFVPLRSSTPVVITLARVLWPQHHPDRFCISKPVKVWCLNLFESTSRNRFTPVDSILVQYCIGRVI